MHLLLSLPPHLFIDFVVGYIPWFPSYDFVLPASTFVLGHSAFSWVPCPRILLFTCHAIRARFGFSIWRLPFPHIHSPSPCLPIIPMPVTLASLFIHSHSLLVPVILWWIVEYIPLPFLVSFHSPHHIWYIPSYISLFIHSPLLQIDYDSPIPHLLFVAFHVPNSVVRCRWSVIVPEWFLFHPLLFHVTISPHHLPTHTTSVDSIIPFIPIP